MGFVFRMFHGGFIVCSAKHTECCMKSGMIKCSCCIKSGLRFRTLYNKTKRDTGLKPVSLHLKTQNYENKTELLL